MAGGADTRFVVSAFSRSERLSRIHSSRSIKMIEASRKK